MVDVGGVQIGMMYVEVYELCLLNGNDAGIVGGYLDIDGHHELNAKSAHKLALKCMNKKGVVRLQCQGVPPRRR